MKRPPARSAMDWNMRSSDSAGSDTAQPQYNQQRRRGSRVGVRRVEFLDYRMSELLHTACGDERADPPTTRDGNA
jgi:hypothetical protein